MKSIKFGTIRRRNQTISFLVFLLLVVIMGLTMITNPWYRIPVEWYFIPVLGLVGAFMVPAFFGRHYCGQYCPTGFLADSFRLVNRAPEWLKNRRFRWFFVALLAAIFVVAFLPWSMGLPASMTQSYWQATMNKLWILWLVCPFTIALPLVILLGLSMGGRTWCNYLCPWGAIGVALGRGQVEITSECTDCRVCATECPQPEVLLPVLGQGGDVDKNCLVCLRCADACPTDGAIRLKS